MNRAVIAIACLAAGTRRRALGRRDCIRLPGSHNAPPRGWELGQRVEELRDLRRSYEELHRRTKPTF